MSDQTGPAGLTREPCGHIPFNSQAYAEALDRVVELERQRDAQRARADAREAGRRVWVLQSLEDGGLIELHGVYTDLEQAKHALEPKYPNLSVWEPCPDRPDCWWAHTGKHPVLIEPAILDAATSRESAEPAPPLCVPGRAAGGGERVRGDAD